MIFRLILHIYVEETKVQLYMLKFLKRGILFSQQYSEQGDEMRILSDKNGLFSTILSIIHKHREKFFYFLKQLRIYSFVKQKGLKPISMLS